MCVLLVNMKNYWLFCLLYWDCGGGVCKLMCLLEVLIWLWMSNRFFKILSNGVCRCNCIILFYWFCGFSWYWCVRSWLWCVLKVCLILIFYMGIMLMGVLIRVMWVGRYVRLWLVFFWIFCFLMVFCICIRYVVFRCRLICGKLSCWKLRDRLLVNLLVYMWIIRLCNEILGCCNGCWIV